MAVARRIYDQAAHGRNVAVGGPAPRAVLELWPARSPPTIRARCGPRWRRCSSTRSPASRSPPAAARSLASAAPAYAPVSGTIRSGGRVVGRYVLAVSEDRAFTGLAHSLTGATVRFVRSARAGRRRVVPGDAVPVGRATVSLAPATCRPRCAAPPPPTRA